MIVKLTRNRKLLVAAAIVTTSSLFYLAVLGSVDRIPAPVLLVFLLAMGVGLVLLFIGLEEEGRKRNLQSSHAPKVTVERH